MLGTYLHPVFDCNHKPFGPATAPIAEMLEFQSCQADEIASKLDASWILLRLGLLPRRVLHFFQNRAHKSIWRGKRNNHIMRSTIQLEKITPSFLIALALLCAAAAPKVFGSVHRRTAAIPAATRQKAKTPFLTSPAGYTIQQLVYLHSRATPQATSTRVSALGRSSPTPQTKIQPLVPERF